MHVASHPETSSPTARAAAHPVLDRGALAVLVLLAVLVAPALAWLAWGGPAPAHVLPRAVVWSALLALALPLLQIAMHLRAFGGPAVRGNRDGYPRASGALGRVVRAHANLVESLVAFAAVALAAELLGVANRLTAAAAGLYVLARLVHAVTYVLGVPVVRSAAFYAGVLATVVIAVQL